MIDRCCPLAFVAATSFACGLVYLCVLMAQLGLR
jgi:hypothetical protein